MPAATSAHPRSVGRFGSQPAGSWTIKLPNKPPTREKEVGDGGGGHEARHRRARVRRRQQAVRPRAFARWDVAAATAAAAAASRGAPRLLCRRCGIVEEEAQLGASLEERWPGPGTLRKV